MRMNAQFFFLIVMFWLLGGRALGDPISDAAPLWSILRPGSDAQHYQSQELSSVSAVVRSASPAVVTIYTNILLRPDPGSTKQIDLTPDRILPNSQSMARRKGIGSGFIIRKDGYLVTNHHVVDGASSIVAHLVHFGEALEARVVGSDPYSDLALLKVEATRPLPVLPLGNSTDIPVGAWVVAVGSPFGIEQAVTLGIISGKGRALRDLGNSQSGYFDLIQTDALIQTGCSGGPLINLWGEVVGITTAANSRVRGIGFAIPVDLAKAVLPQLRKHGKLVRAYLGLRVDPVSWKAAEAAGLDKPSGVLITKVLQKTPAVRAGMKEGDILLKFAGHEIRGPGEMNWRASTCRVGENLRVVIWRKGKQMTLQIKPVARTPPKDSRPGDDGLRAATSKGRLGLRVADLDPRTSRNHGLQEHIRGVVVLGFESDAAATRLRIGDIITEVHGVEISNSKQFDQATQGLNGQPVIRLSIVRQRQVLFVALPWN